MLDRLLFPIFAIALYLIEVGPVFAQTANDTTAVVVPWGTWVWSFMDGPIGLSGIAVTLAWAAFQRFAPPILRLFVSRQEVADAVNYAIGAVAGAVRGKQVDIRVANQLVETAITYLISKEPAVAKALAGWLRPKIVAELVKAGVMPEGSSAASLFAPMPAK